MAGPGDTPGAGQPGQAWHIEWLWIGGYSSLSTVILIFNVLLLFSIGKNKFLHYSFHYVMIMLAIRNVLRVLLSLGLVFLTKLVQTPWLLSSLFQLERELDPVSCQVLCMTDHVLATLLMFYLASLALAVFCRPPHPRVTEYHAAASKRHVVERCWVSPLLLLLPALFSLLLVLPAPLLPETHALAALPDPAPALCTTPGDPSTFQNAVAILGFLLPSAVIICLVIGLAFRRCFSCGGGRCVSSFCREEAGLALLALPAILSQLACYLPLLDRCLALLQLPTTGLQLWVSPAGARAAETAATGLALPIILLAILPAYRRFSDKSDPADRRAAVGAGEEGESHYMQQEPQESRASEESIDMALVQRNGYLHDQYDERY